MCGTAVEDEVRFCPKCGAPRGEPMPYAEVLSLEAGQRLAAAGRSYVTPAVTTLILYLFLWLPGFIANLVYLNQAHRDAGRIGRAPDGRGYLVALLVVMGLVPLVIGVLVFAMAGSAAFDIT